MDAGASDHATGSAAHSEILPEATEYVSRWGGVIFTALACGLGALLLWRTLRKSEAPPSFGPPLLQPQLRARRQSRLEPPPPPPVAAPVEVAPAVDARTAFAAGLGGPAFSAPEAKPLKTLDELLLHASAADSDSCRNGEPLTWRTFFYQSIHIRC